MKQCRGNIILTTLLQRFCCFYTYVPRLCFWTNSDIALFAPGFAFDHTGRYTYDAIQEEQYSDPTSTYFLLFLHACPQVVLLDESDIALFAFRIIIPLK